ncbi:hypothetical protein, partial [Campylobacter vicugnae]|uniref:hypothetical protein n=1 Tax=Campylobacter vicugnae TaxID=1660076 RepID=UPI001F219FB1
MRLEAPQIKMRNPFDDLIAIALKERELELKEKGLGLDEQKLAYGAANDEAQRNFLLELEKVRSKNDKDNLDYEFSLMDKYNNKAKADEDLKEKEANMYYGALTEFHDLVGDLESPQQFFKTFREHQKWLGNNKIVDFITNNGAKAAQYNNSFMQNNLNEYVVGD